MSQTIVIRVKRTIIDGVEYLHDRNTNTLYDCTTHLPVGVWNPYEEEDDIDEDNDEDNEQNLDTIIKSIDRMKLCFKANVDNSRNRQLCTCNFEFFVKEEKRNKKCELVAELNKRYILETNAEKKNRLKQLVNTTTESIKSDLLEMIEDTDGDEGLYLLY